MRKAVSIFGLFFSAPLLALEPHSYTYIEAGWFDRTAEWDLQVDAPKDEVEGDGWSIAGSYHVDSGALFQIHYSEGEIDKAWGYSMSRLSDVLGANVDFDIKSYGFLVGGANQVNDRLSAWAGFGYTREELELSISGFSGSEDYDIDEYSLGGGIRYSVIEMLELNAGARIVHFRADETDLLDEYKDTDGEISVGVRFQPFTMFSIGATYARLLDADSEIVKADARLQF